MAYRATPNTITGYSPFHLLLGRKMTLPSTDDMKAKLSKEVNNSDHIRRLDNLKSSLKLVYQSVKKENRKSHPNNKMLCDRKAKLRTSEIGELVCLYNPAKKPGHRGQGAKCGPQGQNRRLRGRGREFKHRTSQGEYRTDRTTKI
jgi:hypothetical protein